MKGLYESVLLDDQSLSSLADTTGVRPYLPKNKNALPAALDKGHSNLFSVLVRNCTMQNAIETIIDHVTNHMTANFAFVNADCLNKAWCQPDYRLVLNRMADVYADGIGVKLAARLQGEHILENVNGTDMFPLLCEQAAKKNLKLFLLGARPGVAEICAEKMKKRFSNLCIAGTQDGYFKENETQQVINRINESGADILIVAFGAPLQELWMDKYRNEVEVPVCIGVGGCIDFYAERIRRAPKWMRTLSIEWVWRLMQEPKRMWRRYIIGNPLFLYRAFLWAHQ